MLKEIYLTQDPKLEHIFDLHDRQYPFALGGYAYQIGPIAYIPPYVLACGILLITSILLINISLLRIFKQYKKHVTKRTYSLQLMLYRAVMIHAMSMFICVGIICFLLYVTFANEYFFVQIMIHVALSAYSFLNNVILLASVRTFRNFCFDGIYGPIDERLEVAENTRPITFVFHVETLGHILANVIALANLEIESGEFVQSLEEEVHNDASGLVVHEVTAYDALVNCGLKIWLRVDFVCQI
uniref:Uncharacterized protein n=1 Tax=Acrobeloides nanus TaxID=290746 RepID=A0A914CR29_9BILA